MNPGKWFISLRGDNQIYQKVVNQESIKFINVFNNELIDSLDENYLLSLESIYGTARYFDAIIKESNITYDADTQWRLSLFLMDKFNGLSDASEFIHLKTGNKYFVNGVVRDCTNDTEWDCIVLYRRSTELTLYARRLSEFLKKFKYND